MKLTAEQTQALKNVVFDIRKGSKRVLLGGYAGTGKASGNNAVVYTPFGQKRMGDIKIGDQVSNPDGSVAKVIGVYPQGMKQIYKVTFVDGSSTRVTGDHLWLYSRSSRKQKAERIYIGNNDAVKYKIGTTEQLKEYIGQESKKNRPSWPLIPLTKPVQFTIVGNKERLTIDPYTMGLLLGDGGMSSTKVVTYTSADDELLSYLQSNGYKLSKKKGSDINHVFVGESTNELKKQLLQFGLLGKKSHDKFIPKDYLCACVEDRFRLLQGLMDTDGSTDKNGGCEFSSVSKDLAEGVQWLIRSLGGKATMRTKIGSYRSKKTGEVIKCKMVYRIYIQIPNRIDLFRLSRKKNSAFKKFNGGASVMKNRMISIEEDGQEECTCIQVDHPNSLYITDDFVVTHNTTVIKYLIKFFPSFGVAAYTGKAANVLRKKDIQASTIHSRIYKPFFDNGVVHFDLTPDPGCDGFIIDEASMVSKDIYEDLETFGLPMIFVGDHGQLEPVESNFNLMEVPDYTLEEIHRNAGDIAKFAEHLRKGFSSRGFKCEDGSVEFLYDKKLSDTQLMLADQVICAFNATRCEINQRIRKAKGFTNLVEVGERVMCLRNNRKAGLFNGMQGTVLGLTVGKYGRKYMDFQFDDTILEGVWYEESNFGKDSYKFKIGSDTPNPFDYAHCITTHKCVHPDTLVETTEGLLPISEIPPNGMIATPNGIKQYVNHVTNQAGPAVRMVTEHGYEITMTPDHRVEAWTGENYSQIYARDLVKGQFVRLKKSVTIDPVAPAKLPDMPEGDIRARRMRLPIFDENVAEFFGLMVADGTTFRGGFRLAKRHKDVLDRYAFLVESLFGCQPRQVEIGKTYAYEVSSTILSEWISMVGGMDPNNKHVPHCVLRSPASFHKAFLRGVMEDGTVSLKNGKSDHIEFSCHSKPLINTVRTMLLRLGMVTSSAKYKLYMYGSSAVKFREEIGFISSFKNNRLAGFTRSDRYSVIPVSKEESVSLKQLLSRSDYNNIINRGYVSTTKMPDVKFLRERSEYHHDRVALVEQTSCPSMCVEVTDGHRFLQNGFPFWNSQGDEFDKVLVVEQKCKKWDHKRWAYTSASRAKSKLLWKMG